MFIIFDLDDTLVDTSACITPFKLERALTRMVGEGLQLEDFSKGLDQLLRLDSQSESAGSALEEFLEINGFDISLLQIAKKEVYDTFSHEIPVFPTEDAIETLLDLSCEHKMAIVSVGQLDQQLFKLEKAGIDTSLFCKILVLEERNKKEPYLFLMQELDLSPREVIVCGDRVSIDLAPAKQLGFSTVHMKNGRGMLSRGSESDVDFTITKLSQMKRVLSELNNKIMVG